MYEVCPNNLSIPTSHICQATKVSAQRKQLNEDQERWERSRMLISGAVQRVGPDDDIEDEEEDKVGGVFSPVDKLFFGCSPNSYFFSFAPLSFSSIRSNCSRTI